MSRSLRLALTGLADPADDATETIGPRTIEILGTHPTLALPTPATTFPWRATDLAPRGHRTSTARCAKEFDSTAAHGCRSVATRRVQSAIAISPTNVDRLVPGWANLIRAQGVHGR